MSADHLNALAAAALTLPSPDRIAFCLEDRWVGYTLAQDVLQLLEDTLAQPRSLRMRNLLILGRSGNGKSSVLERFVHAHPILMTADGAPIAPIVQIQMPATPDESELWSTILWALGISHREKDPAHIKKNEVKSTLQYVGLRMLVIDEFNHLVNAGKRAGELLSAIKELSNALNISIVAAGTEAAINALSSDMQMRKRFDCVVLRPWAANAEYKRFLASYIALLPLARPSALSGDVVRAVFALSGATLGDTVNLLKAAAVHAIRSGAECVDLDVLNGLNWRTKQDWDAARARM